MASARITPRLHQFNHRVSSSTFTSVRSLAPRFSSSRSMASAPPVKNTWVVIVPDCKDSLDRRMAVRPEHLAALTPRVEDGFWKLGGAMLGEPAQEGKPLDIQGSIMLASADTREEVLEELRKDVYFKNKVWDTDKIQIHPFKVAFIKP